MSKVYLVSIRWVESKANLPLIDGTLGGIGDWIRWNGYTWFVTTNLAIPEIRARILPLLKAKDSLLIMEVNPAGADGWAAKWIWDWFVSKIIPK